MDKKQTGAPQKPRVYSRSIGKIVGKALLTLLAAAAAYGALWILLQFLYIGKWGSYLLYGVPALICLSMAYLIVVADSGRFTLLPGGTLEHYRLGRKMKSYDLNKCVASYINQSELSGGKTSRDYSLEITNATGVTETIDCSGLGARGFRQMFRDIKKLEKQLNPVPEFVLAQLDEAQGENAAEAAKDKTELSQATQSAAPAEESTKAEDTPAETEPEAAQTPEEAEPEQPAAPALEESGKEPKE